MSDYVDNTPKQRAHDAIIGHGDNSHSLSMPRLPEAQHKLDADMQGFRDWQNGIEQKNFTKNSYEPVNGAKETGQNVTPLKNSDMKQRQAPGQVL